MGAACPRCGANGSDDFVKQKDVDWDLGGSWGCLRCGYIKGGDNHVSNKPSEGDS